jgi:hypothetical protein
LRDDATLCGVFDMPTNNSPRKGPGSPGLVGPLREHADLCCHAIILFFLIFFSLAILDAFQPSNYPASRDNPDSIHRLNDLIT